MNVLNHEIQAIRTSIETLEKELSTGEHTQEEENLITDKIIALNLELRKRYKQAVKVE